METARAEIFNQEYVACACAELKSLGNNVNLFELSILEKHISEYKSLKSTKGYKTFIRTPEFDKFQLENDAVKKNIGDFVNKALQQNIAAFKSKKAYTFPLVCAVVLIAYYSFDDGSFKNRIKLNRENYDDVSNEQIEQFAEYLLALYSKFVAYYYCYNEQLKTESSNRIESLSCNGCSHFDPEERISCLNYQICAGQWQAQFRFRLGMKAKKEEIFSGISKKLSIEYENLLGNELIGLIRLDPNLNAQIEYNFIKSKEYNIKEDTDKYSHIKYSEREKVLHELGEMILNDIANWNEKLNQYNDIIKKVTDVDYASNLTYNYGEENVNQKSDMQIYQDFINEFDAETFNEKFGNVEAKIGLEDSKHSLNQIKCQKEKIAMDQKYTRDLITGHLFELWKYSKQLNQQISQIKLKEADKTIKEIKELFYSIFKSIL